MLRRRWLILAGVAALASATSLSTITSTASTTYPADELSGVACPAMNNCVAVGYSSLGETGGDPTYTLAERWLNGSWSVRPTGGLEGSLDGVSCGTAATCTAVGDVITSDSSGTTATLAEGGNGAKWSVETTPTPAGATNAGLASVSCTSATDCMAVGFYSDPVTTEARFLAEHWNGSAWTILPNPACTAVNCDFTSISCSAPNTCMAIGDNAAYSWNGTTWNPQATPSGEDYYSVSCPKTNSCMAVGNSDAANWNGVSWSSVSPGGSVALQAVSCSSSTLCTAVGLVPNSAGTKNVPIADRWNGASWTVQDMPYSKSFYAIAITAVKCREAAPCMAVGYVQHDPGDFPVIKTLAELWNGSNWAIQKSPNP
jgi:hypothetical protein